MNAAIVVPFRNEGERVLEIARSAQNAMNEGVVSEAFFIDDNSTDQTWAELELLDGITLSRTRPEHSGKAPALDTGVQQAKDMGCDTAVFADADMHGVTPATIEELLSPLKEGAIMSIGYIGIRRHFADLPPPFNRFGSLSGLRALRMEAWDTLSGGWFEGRSDKNSFNEAVLNGRVAKLDQPVARVAIEGVGHVSKYNKTGSLPKALAGYTKTYMHALRASAWVAFEPADSELGIPESGAERISNADQFIRAGAAHRKLRNMMGVVAVTGGAILGATGSGELPNATELELVGALMASTGLIVGIGNEIRQLEYALRSRSALRRVNN